MELQSIPNKNYLKDILKKIESEQVLNDFNRFLINITKMDTEFKI